MQAGVGTRARHAGDRLVAAIEAIGTPACVGLDPVAEKLPGGLGAGGATGAVALGLERFSCGVIDACAGSLGIVKVQSACFERHGSAGYAAMERVVAHARGRGMFVILDGKRGDIGISAEHYAQAAAGMGADAVTVNGYLGRSGVRPFVDAGLGVFVLVRTSNPDAEEVQDAKLAEGGTVSGRVAELVEEIAGACRGATHVSSVGAVVALGTRGTGERGEPSAVDELREAMPDSVFLVPGIGAQGGEVSAARSLLRGTRVGPGTAGVVLTASRSVIYASQGEGAGAESWEAAVSRAARSFAAEAAALVR